MFKKAEGKKMSKFFMITSIIRLVMSVLMFIIIAVGAYVLFNKDNIGLAALPQTQNNSEMYNMVYQNISDKLSGSSINPSETNLDYEFDSNGNIVIDVDEIINEWEYHPFYKGNQELIDTGEVIIGKIIDDYLNDDDYAVLEQKIHDSVVVLNDFFYAGYLDINKSNAMKTISFSDDIRLNLVALEYSQMLDPGVVYEIIALDKYHGNNFEGMNVEEVSDYIIDFFSN